MTSTDVQPFTPKPFFLIEQKSMCTLSWEGVLLWHVHNFQNWCRIHAADPLCWRCRLITLIASNKKQLDKLKETWSAVSGCAQIRLLSSPSFHRDRKCAWGMLRQPCLNYSLTLWPVSRIDTAAAATCCGAVQRGRHGITLVGGGEI